MAFIVHVNKLHRRRTHILRETSCCNTVHSLNNCVIHWNCEGVDFSLSIKSIKSFTRTRNSLLVRNTTEKNSRNKILPLYRVLTRSNQPKFPIKCVYESHVNIFVLQTTVQSVGLQLGTELCRFVSYSYQQNVCLQN